MSKSASDDSRFNWAVQQLFIWQQIDGGVLSSRHTCGNAMKEAGFSESESKNRTLQQRVRHMANQWNESSTRPSPPATIHLSNSADGSESQTSTVTSAESLSSETAIPKASRSTYNLPGNCRLTAQQKQVARKLTFKENQGNSVLHKLATSTVADAKKSGDRRGTEKILQDLAETEGIPRNALPSFRTVNF